MKKLTKTASVLDKVLHILSIVIKVSFVAQIVALGILCAGFLFDLPPHMIGTGYAHADLGFVSFTVADSIIPDHHILWKQLAVEMLLTLACLIPAHFMVKTFRSILAPMKNGEPFREGVSKKLNYLARYVCGLGIGINLQKIVSNVLITQAFDLPNLLLSDKITEVDFFFVFDFSFLLVVGILLLLSYIFRYGEELQRLSDETL